MKLIEDVLFLEFEELVGCGVPDETIKKAKSRNSSSWHFMDDPQDRRRVLIGYEKLKPAYKDKVLARYGNPYEYVAKSPIMAMVRHDHQAETYYMRYRYDGGKMLGIGHVKRYTLAASWLNMLVEMGNDRKLLKRLLNLSVETFYEQVIGLVKAEGVGLPKSYRRLLATRDDYRERGYAALIDWRWGNQLAAKINDEVSESVLLEMLAHGNQYDDVFVRMCYNKWATENGYKTIDAATVGVWRRKRYPEIIMQREGNAALNGKYLSQAKGFAPTQPLYMVESDDNHLDLLFTDPDDNTAHRHYHRYKAIVVMDACQKYVLGYAYAQTMSAALVRLAYINAMRHVRELTGGWYLPHEIKTDNWAIKELRPFYEGIGNYMKTPVGSKHRGYIEQFFGSPHWKRCLKFGANNYTGNNMTAVTRGVNTEALVANQKDRVLLGPESESQVEKFFHRLRHMEQPGGMSSQQQWLAAWAAMPESAKRPATDEQYLLKFGIMHNPGNTIQITSRGVEPQIAGRKYSYNIEGGTVYHIGRAVQVIYDPCDMNRVLVTDGKDLRLLAHSAVLHSRSMADATEGGRAYLNETLAKKKDTVDYLSAKSDKRKDLVDRIVVDPENFLVGGNMDKYMKQRAEEEAAIRALGQPPERPERPYNPFDQM